MRSDPPAPATDAGDGACALLLRIATAPHLRDAPAARARIADWLAEIAGTAAGAELTRLLAAKPKLAELLAGIGEGSSYLWDLMRAAPERLVADMCAWFSARGAEVCEQKPVHEDVSFKLPVELRRAERAAA